MTRFLPICIFALSIAIPTSLATAQTIPLTFNHPSANQLDVQIIDNQVTAFTTQGQDPHIELTRFEPDQIPTTHTILAFEYFSPQGIQDLAIYFGPPINAKSQFSAGPLNQAEAWVPHAIDLKSLSNSNWTRQKNQLRLDFGKKPGRTLRIRNLHLRPPNATELRTQSQRLAQRQLKLTQQSQINAFYKTTFPDQINSVTLDTTHVTITGHVQPHIQNARLIEIQPEISIANSTILPDGSFILKPQPGIRDRGPMPLGSFKHRLPRIHQNLDRTTSRWAIVQIQPNGHLLLRSHWKYPTNLSQAAPHRPQLKPKGVKGMGGLSPHFPLQELVELGVHNITINITLSSLLDTKPRPNWTPFKHAGQTWYANTPQLKQYDILTSFAAQNDIIVSGILLVNFSPSPFGQMLVHPQAQRAGHYAMPNFTSAQGVAAYQAVIELLAQRYSIAASPQGTIANWIIHNEVGYGWVWTNMGKQPPMLYMDHYLRSMRLVHNITRRHDPHARVFISLTHHWNSPPDPTWKAYSNLALVERLIESTQLEGDFAWGLAYHPYPQNLRKPDAWNDTQVTNDFQTPLITPKNIAVLDRWMHLPKMRDTAGNTRAVLLSEQGFNSPDYSQENQRLQAAGYVYMWRQMQGLKTIEAFHNHRWVDHPNEGGLLLGIRKLPTNSKPYGPKKFGWEVYKALDTPTEKTATQFANDLINNR